MKKAKKLIYTKAIEKAEKNCDYNAIKTLLSANFESIVRNDFNNKGLKKTFEDTEAVVKDDSFQEGIEFARKVLNITKYYSAEEIYQHELNRTDDDRIAMRGDLLIDEVFAIHEKTRHLDKLIAVIGETDPLAIVSKIVYCSFDEFRRQILPSYWLFCVNYFILQPNLIDEISKMDKDKQRYMKKLVTAPYYFRNMPQITDVDESYITVKIPRGAQQYQFESLYKAIQPYIKGKVAAENANFIDTKAQKMRADKAKGMSLSQIGIKYLAKNDKKYDNIDERKKLKDKARKYL